MENEKMFQPDDSQEKIQACIDYGKTIIKRIEEGENIVDILRSTNSDQSETPEAYLDGAYNYFATLKRPLSAEVEEIVDKVLGYISSENEKLKQE